MYTNTMSSINKLEYVSPATLLVELASEAFICQSGDNYTSGVGVENLIEDPSYSWIF